MPTSGSCLPDRGHARQRPVRGFTLLEMVVVLGVLSLLAALVAPQLFRTYRAVMARGELDGIVGQLASLSLRANGLGVAFALSPDAAARLLPDGRPLVELPAGWQLSADPPIRFNFVGLCSGGIVRLRSPLGEQIEITLDAPACEIRSPSKDSGRF